LVRQTFSVYSRLPQNHECDEAENKGPHFFDM
jgi:hypothetical protein